MLSIILLASDEVTAKAKAAGFTETTVLIKRSGGQSTEEHKARLERELIALHPYQFLVSDYWGLNNEW